MLTGVRGVGKTTTARLLARALNAEPKPSVDLSVEGPHDRAIQGRVRRADERLEARTGQLRNVHGQEVIQARARGLEVDDETRSDHFPPPTLPAAAPRREPENAFSGIAFPSLQLFRGAPVFAGAPHSPAASAPP